MLFRSVYFQCQCWSLSQGCLVRLLRLKSGRNSRLQLISLVNSLSFSRMAPRNKENKDSKSRRAGNTSSREDSDQEWDKDGDEYRKRRDRNNQAVRRSRVKSRMRTQQTLERVNQLKTENELLEEKIRLLTKELGFLKDLFLAHAGNAHGLDLKDIDLEQLLRDEPKGTTSSASTSTSMTSTSRSRSK